MDVPAYYSNLENLVLRDRRRSRPGGVRDGWLCFGVFLKSQIPSTPPKRQRAGKIQINHKPQYSMTKTFQDETLFGISNFGHWKLFVICNLEFVISIS